MRPDGAGLGGKSVASNADRPLNPGMNKIPLCTMSFVKTLGPLIAIPGVAENGDRMDQIFRTNRTMSARRGFLAKIPDQLRCNGQGTASL